MPALLVKNLDASLLREINYAADEQGLTQRDYVVKILAQAVGWEAPSGEMREARRNVDAAQVPGRPVQAMRDEPAGAVEEAGKPAHIEEASQNRSQGKSRDSASVMSKSDALRAMRERKFNAG